MVLAEKLKDPQRLCPPHCKRLAVPLADRSRVERLMDTAPHDTEQFPFQSIDGSRVERLMHTVPHDTEKFPFQSIDGSRVERLMHTVPHDTEKFPFQSIDGSRVERLMHTVPHDSTVSAAGPTAHEVRYSAATVLQCGIAISFSAKWISGSEGAS